MQKLFDASNAIESNGINELHKHTSYLHDVLCKFGLPMSNLEAKNSYDKLELLGYRYKQDALTKGMFQNSQSAFALTIPTVSTHEPLT